MYIIFQGGEAQGSDGGEGSSLGVCEFGMPHVDDEDEPPRRAVVPHLVLETVVKHHHLAFLPAPRTWKYTLQLQ